VALTTAIDRPLYHALCTENENALMLHLVGVPLLGTLVKNAGVVMTHRRLLRGVWGPGSGEENHCLRVYMNQLRQTREPDAARPRHLLTETGVGYRLAVIAAGDDGTTRPR
jgi:two-component system, OmpR family, KDP operon response regulator KdpE